jgi:hypothetical protein
VKQSREKHTGLLRSIDKSTRTKIYGFDNLIHDGKEDMRQLLKQQAELEYELRVANTSIGSEYSQGLKNKASLRAAELNVSSIRKRLREVNKMIAEVKESVRDKKRHDVNMSRLTGDLSKVERKTTRYRIPSQNRVSS